MFDTQIDTKSTPYYRELKIEAVFTCASVRVLKNSPKRIQLQLRIDSKHYAHVELTANEAKAIAEALLEGAKLLK